MFVEIKFDDLKINLVYHVFMIIFLKYEEKLSPN